jgi:hypothetical protein
MTMTEPFYLGAYWGPRGESVSACAERLTTCLLRIGSLAPLAATWYRKAGRRKDAMGSPVSVESSALRELLLAGVNRRDFGGDVINELGFSVSLWNGDSRAPVGFSVTCGAAPSTPGVMNSFVLNLPSPEAGGAQFYEPSTARALVMAVVAAWEPDWATFASHRLREAVDPAPRQPVTGWITYLSARGRRPVPSRLGAVVEQLDDGALVVSAASVDEIDTNELRGLAATLEKAGTLTPTR